jgi:hypothetical protein
MYTPCSQGRTKHMQRQVSPLMSGWLCLLVWQRYKLHLNANKGYHLMGSMVETRRFQAMGQLDSTCRYIPILVAEMMD